MARTVTLIPGDGIGPECTDATKKIIEASGVKIDWEVRHAGESVFKQGVASGVPKETMDSIKKTRLVLKGPLGTPIGYGEKSANVTLRKLYETYANIRPVREFPGVTTPYSGRGIDLVIVRENVEDLYAGIEYMQTPGVAETLKLISRKGSEKIVRMAFEFARSEGRKKVSVATKSNIMKFSEGMMKRTLEDIAKEYPDIQSEHIIVDNCAHQLVKKPEQFDVICMTNMNGDILSDLSSALVGGLGFAPSANLGNEVAIFEAVHGSAPKYAGKNTINPTAVLLSGVAMLRYMGEFEAASKIENAVMVTLESGCITRDILGDAKGIPTTKYAETVISNLGKKSAKWKVRDYKPIKMPNVKLDQAFVVAKTRKTIGVDVFIESAAAPELIGKSVEKLVEGSPLQLKMIDSRGTKVYPPTGAITDNTDAFRCRLFMRDAAGEMSDAQCFDVIARIAKEHKWTHIEKLHEFDGKPSFTKAQGED
ncbi:MAG: NADP-dependent isocitrate dehydrogenase [Planctomycetes bacterium]|nr:NADP-dependent isocitrate dehydrogenase [Planctomycetota bacterium]